MGIATLALPWSWLSAMLSALARLMVMMSPQVRGKVRGVVSGLAQVCGLLTELWPPAKLRLAQVGGNPGPHAGKQAVSNKSGPRKRRPVDREVSSGSGPVGTVWLSSLRTLSYTPHDPTLPDPRPNICVHERQWHG